LGIVLDYKVALTVIKELIANNEESKVLQKVVDFLFESFEKYSWIGVYIVQNDDLILGPWCGKQSTEHKRIPIGQGICGSAAKTGKTVIVPDVSKDNRYLSCFVTTQSEIVVPIKKNEKVIGEIDIDSDIPDAFDEKDAVFLEKIATNRTILNILKNIGMKT
jgi:GAF domain-containing protein